MSTAAASADFAHIGKSVNIKGELSGSEDIYVDGQVEGSIQLAGNSLTVGPNGRVRANVTARNVTVGGTLDGNIQASERTELRKSAVVNGDVQTKRIAIEEGAYFKGKLEILTDSKPQSGAGTTAKA
jgi:cytoskeletal protein CcmA (bactofilin family)